MNEILEKLESKGFNAYIVGGYVRDYLLGIESFDVDICTNASLDNIIKILGRGGKAYKEYYSYHLNDGVYNYDITTFRKELEYINNKPTKLLGVNDLYIDLLRRDFTINTICMDKDGNILDLFDAKRDLDNKIIKVVGDTYDRFLEDNTRIVRAIRLSCSLDFEMDNEIKNFIKEKGHLINDLNAVFKKKELDKIFISNPKKFFDMGLIFNFKSMFDIDYNNIVITGDYYGIWAQLNNNYNFNKEEKLIISSIKKLIKKGSIDNMDIYKYGEVVCNDAACILNINIESLVNNLQIHSILDIDISFNDIVKLVSKDKVNDVYKKLEEKILNNSLKNNKCDIIKFIKGEYNE